MLSRVEQFIREHDLLPRGSHALVGVSGGADSAALLHMLARLKDRLGFELSASHFNHGIRPDAGEDEALVRALCEALGVELFVGRSDVPALARAQKVSLEVAARDARHAFFRETMAVQGMDRLALAHHRDDQAETVLLRLLRGSGAMGLGAMAPREASGIVRPLLCVGREETRAWCRENGIAWREDATNEDTSIPRNYVRHELMPHLEVLNPDASGALCRAAELLRRDEEALGALAEEAIRSARDRSGGGVAIPPDALEGLPEAVRSRALRLLMKRAGLLRDVELANVEEAEKLIAPGMTGRRADLGGGFVALREAGALVILPELPESAVYEAAPLTIPGETEACGGVFTCERLAALPEDIRGHGAFTQYFDADAFPGDAVARGRLPGDRFRPLGAPGGRKLKEFLIDRKTPRWERDAIPLLASGSDVLWAVGLAISDGVKVTQTSKTVLKIQYTRGKSGL